MEMDNKLIIYHINMSMAVLQEFIEEKINKLKSTDDTQMTTFDNGYTFKWDIENIGYVSIEKSNNYEVGNPNECIIIKADYPWDAVEIYNLVVEWLDNIKMNKNKILKIAEHLSEEIIDCELVFNENKYAVSKVNIHGIKITSDKLEKYFNKYKVGIDCHIKKFVFKPKNKKFIVSIKNGHVSCSKYADKRESEKVISIVNEILKK